MKRLAILLGILVTVAIVTGCSTASASSKYRPQTLGMASDGYADSGLSIMIDTKDEVAVPGEPLVFDVVYKNVGTSSFLLPREPNILFAWTYSDGKRDNYLVDYPKERFYKDSEVVELKPGDTLVQRFPVKTYYYDRYGITEFRAVLAGVPNSNPNVEKVWVGRSVSNAYGVMISKTKTYALKRTSVTLAAK